jgi:hypothetical protein
MGILLKVLSRPTMACMLVFSFGTLVKVVDMYLVKLECMNKEENDWSDHECIFCPELLKSGPIGMTSCGHMFHHLCWSNHHQVLSTGQPQAPCPM